MSIHPIFKPWRGIATFEFPGAVWRIAPNYGSAERGAACYVSNQTEALASLQEIDELWRNRRASPRTGCGLLIGCSYEFGVALQSVNTKAPQSKAGMLRWFECKPIQELPWIETSVRRVQSKTVRASLSLENYSTSFESIRASIAAGEFYQLNLCRQFEVEGAPSPHRVWRSLSRATSAPAAMAAYWDDEAWLSFSPEPFLVGSIEGEVQTVPIKGTRLRGSSPLEDVALAEELEGSSKDRAELMMIVDLERNDLTRICLPGSVSRTVVPELHKYSEVMHLLARVKGKLRPEVGFSQMMRATFPGGSITGAPKLAVMQAIAGLEPVPRGLFTGAIWWLGDDGKFASSITIRTLEWLAARRVRFGAGGGITWNSTVQGEWKEANAKARPFAHALGFIPEDL